MLNRILQNTGTTYNGSWSPDGCQLQTGSNMFSRSLQSAVCRQHLLIDIYNKFNNATCVCETVRMATHTTQQVMSGTIFTGYPANQQCQSIERQNGLLNHMKTILTKDGEYHRNKQYSQI